MANQLLSDFMHTFAKQSGVDVTSDGFKLFMSDPKLTELFIDDEFTKQIQDSHLTFESAKNNPDLQKHFTAATLSGVDNALKRALNNMGASKEVMDVFNGEEKTLKKVEMVAGKLKEVYDKPQENPDTEKLVKEKQDYVNKINELQEQVNVFPETLQQRESELNDTFQSKINKYKIHGKLSGYKFNSTIPRDEIYDLVDIKLGKLPYVIREKDGELTAFQKDNPDLLAQKDSKTISVTDILDTVVSPFIDKGTDTQPPSEPRKSEPASTPSKGAQSKLEEKMEAAAKKGRISAFS